MTSVRLVPTGDLTPGELRAIRALCDAAWAGPDEPFDDDDWNHALGGVHAVLEDDGEIVAHGSVVPRTLRAGGARPGRRLRRGRGDPAAPAGRGFGSAVMRDAEGAHRRHLRARRPVHGRSLVLRAPRAGPAGRGRRRCSSTATPRRTPDEDGAVLVRFTPSSPRLDPTRPDQLRLAAGRRLVAAGSVARCRPWNSDSASSPSASPTWPAARAFYERLGWKRTGDDEEVAFFQSRRHGGRAVGPGPARRGQHGRGRRRLGRRDARAQRAVAGRGGRRAGGGEGRGRPHRARGRGDLLGRLLRASSSTRTGIRGRSRYNPFWPIAEDGSTRLPG